MGLDMYAFATTERLSVPVDFTVKEAVEIFYWRKHPDLHGWMENLYHAKGGQQEQFNCATVQLTAKDLYLLEDAVQSCSLPHTTGFFFATTLPEERKRDLEFIDKAREHIAAGKDVFYDSWW